MLQGGQNLIDPKHALWLACSARTGGHSHRSPCSLEKVGKQDVQHFWARVQAERPCISSGATLQTHRESVLCLERELLSPRSIWGITPALISFYSTLQWKTGLGKKSILKKNPNKIMPQWNVNLWDGIYSRNRWVEGESVLFQEILLVSIGSSSSLYQKDIHQGSMATWDLCLLSFSSELRAACAD